MSRLAHRNTYLGEGNNREKGTSNDNDDYYYCSEDVGELVNQPHAECFPLVRLALPPICQLREHCEACCLRWFISSYKYYISHGSWVSRNRKNKRLETLETVVCRHSGNGTAFKYMQTRDSHSLNSDNSLSHTHTHPHKYYYAQHKSKHCSYCGSVGLVYFWLYNYNFYT